VQKVATLDNELAVRVGLQSGTFGLQVVGPTVEAAAIASDSQAAPGAGTVLADTGALSGGKRTIYGAYGQSDNGFRFFDLEWRNAANTANNAVFHYLHAGINNSESIVPIRLNMVTNERLRWVNVTAIALTAITWIATEVQNDSIA